MLGLRYFLRSNFRQSSISVQANKFSLGTTARSSSDDEDNKTSDEKRKSKIDEKQKKAISKLNALLSTMVEEDKTIAASKVKNALSRPKRVAKKAVPTRQPAKESLVEAAARSVAASLGGNVGKTEAELLSRLLGQPLPEKSLPEPEPVIVRSEESRLETARSLTSLLSEMKIEKKPAAKAENVQRSFGEGNRHWDNRNGGEHGQRRGEWKDRRGESDQYESRPRRKPERVVLFGKESLNIFKTDGPTATEPDLSTWRRCFERELRLAATHPPANHFQEMIQWTDQGKLWQFPIDNEQGMESEKQTSFTRHVFFDGELEGWCSSPEVRHFMDLVCVGLSKNPYITADDKLAHIEWFRKYFADKGHLIDGTGQQTGQQAIAQQ